MSDHPRVTNGWIEPRWALITAAVVAIIVWGSLYPFSFSNRGTLAAGFRYLLQTWPFAPDRGDLTSNILLYSPLGFFAVRALRRLPFAARVVVVTLFGAMLSGSMEFTQFWDAGRAPSIADLYSNTIGTLVGGVAAGLNPRSWNFPLIGKMDWRPYALLLIGFWLGNRMFPYLPSLGVHLEHLKWMPLFERGEAVDWLRQVVNWLAVATLLEALFGVERSRIAIAVMAALAIVWRLLIGVAMPLEEYAALIAVVVWTAAISRLRGRDALVAALFATSVILQALEPFHFLDQARRFGWIPFVSFIQGPRENGIRVFFDKAFTYGALVWLVARAGISWTPATAVCGVLVFALRLLQTYLPGRSAEITDVTMLVMLACVMKMLREAPESY